MQISGQEPEETVAAYEREIDQILADSFPASDAPPWTLGVPVGRPTRNLQKNADWTE